MHSGDRLLQKWDEISHPGGYVRIDSEHPLDWHIGFDEQGKRSLLLRTSFEPRDIPSSKSISVNKAKRVDNNWAVTFKLIQDEHEEVFIRLCFDLIESSRLQQNTLGGLKHVLNRYVQWVKLMELQKLSLLSEAEMKGLIGEILFLQRLIMNGMPQISAVSSWIGPENADKDFMDADGWHEIKTIGIGAQIVSITSIEQLDAELPGELVLYFIDKVAPNAVDAFTLNSKVSEMREILSDDLSALELFNQKLLIYGYIDLPDYDKYWYRISEVRKYRIDENFPRLTRSNIKSQIVAASYQINLQAIENWRIH